MNACPVKHLDISFNRFPQSIMMTFGDVISENHTLWGLHIQGNEAFVDTLGFVHAESKVQS